MHISMPIAVAGILAIAGVSVAVAHPSLGDLLPDLGLFPHHGKPGANDTVMEGGMAGDMPEAQLGMDRPHFPPASGTVPSQEAASKLPQMSQIAITNDTMFNPSHGVRGGNGTLDNPYVISGYDVTGDLYIGDTDACVEIKENWIDGQLRLNWNGQCVFVHHNYIRDLRVNENVARTGLDTGGLIEANTINYIGQIRHYDGEFRNNVVGPRDDANLPYGPFQDPENALPFTSDTRVLNIDGWNEALFDHNTITGSVDLKLHGHHHSTGFLATHSHYHGDSASRMAAMAHDHTNRWESVEFSDNVVTDPTGYGLRYTDENHAGDDRTASSETTKQLDDDHQHHTHAEILRNHVTGAGIWVDIFNADDEKHKVRNPGWLAIEDNTVDVQERDPGALGLVPFVSTAPQYEPQVGIWIMDVKEVQLSVQRNIVSFAPKADSPTAQIYDLEQTLLRTTQSQGPTGILIETARDANITVANNKATGYTFGVDARSMDEKVQWAVYGNDFASAANPVYYDDSVSNHPLDKPLPQGPRWQDDLPPMHHHEM